ncbi:MAG: hypothetical protein E5X60_07540 [Mesorhizobium sp.]|nr:MAG: hypothetical protein E5X60_07540 [Mesorhizobium sp.]
MLILSSKALKTGFERPEPAYCATAKRCRREQSLQVRAAPHPPAGTFSPYSDGEKGQAPTLATPSPRLYTGRG